MHTELSYLSPSNIKRYMAISCIYSIMGIFFQTFLVSYFLSLSNNDIIPTAVYYIIVYTMVAIGFSLLGPIVKSPQKIVLLRWAFLARCLLFGVLLGLGDKVTHHIILVGLLYGFFEAVYNFPNNVLMSEFMQQGRSIRFLGYLNGLKSVFKIIMPFVLGALITFNSYFFTMVIMAGLSLLAYFLCLKLDVKETPRIPFRIKDFFSFLKKTAAVKYAYVIEFLKGLVFETLDILVILYIVLLYQTNFNLGIFSSVFAACTMIIHFIFGRFCTYDYFKKILIVTSILTFFCTLYFIAEPERISFVIYNLCLASAGQLLRIVTEVNMFSVSNMPELKDTWRTEYFAVREIFLNAGRVMGFSLVIFAAILGQAQYIPYVLFSLTCMIFMTSFMALKLDQKLHEPLSSLNEPIAGVMAE